MKTTLENIIFGKLGLNDEIKNKKTSTKKTMIKKIKNKKNKDWSWNTNNQESQAVTFWGWKRE